MDSGFDRGIKTKIFTNRGIKSPSTLSVCIDNGFDNQNCAKLIDWGIDDKFLIVTDRKQKQFTFEINTKNAEIMHFEIF